MRVLILDGTYENKYKDALNHISELYIVNNHIVKIINLEDMNISYCAGCWSCWIKTPGLCCHKDDTHLVLKEVINSDFIVFFTENTLGFVTSLTKKVQDKFVTLIHPYIEIANGECRHIKRYENYPKLSLIYVDQELNKNDFNTTKAIYQGMANDFRSELAFTYHYNGNKEDIVYEDICI